MELLVSNRICAVNMLLHL